MKLSFKNAGLDTASASCTQNCSFTTRENGKVYSFTFLPSSLWYMFAAKQFLREFLEIFLKIKV